MTAPPSEDLERRLRAHVQYLAGDVGDRNSSRYGNLEQARQYIEQSFQASGYEVRHDTYNVAQRTFRNVIAEIPGDCSDGRLLVIGADYDTAPGTPGADDNASGVAGLSELASLLQHACPTLTLRWAAFTLEEPPWFRTSAMGSRVHARMCRERGEQVVGMGSLEMVGYFRDEPQSQHYPVPFGRWFYPDRGPSSPWPATSVPGVSFGVSRDILVLRCPLSPSPCRSYPEWGFRTTGPSGRKGIPH